MSLKIEVTISAEEEEHHRVTITVGDRQRTFLALLDEEGMTECAIVDAIRSTAKLILPAEAGGGLVVNGTAGVPIAMSL